MSPVGCPHTAHVNAKKSAIAEAKQTPDLGNAIVRNSERSTRKRKQEKARNKRKSKRKKGGRRREKKKRKQNLAKPSAWSTAILKGKLLNYFDHERPRKGWGKTKSKTKVNRRKDNSKKTKVVRRMTIGWKTINSRTKLKEVKSNPMDYDRRTPSSH